MGYGPSKSSSRGGGNVGYGMKGYGAELHVKDTFTEAQDIHHLVGQVKLLNGIELGNDADMRTGRVIHLKKLMVRWNMFFATNVNEACTAGVFIIKDIQPGIALPAYDDIFETENVQSFSKIAAVGRFQSVYRHIFQLGPGNVAAGTIGYGGHAFDEVYKTLNQRVKFDGPVDGVIDIFDCAYYLVFIVDYHDGNNPALADRLKIEYHTRMRFADL